MSATCLKLLGHLSVSFTPVEIVCVDDCKWLSNAIARGTHSVCRPPGLRATFGGCVIPGQIV